MAWTAPKTNWVATDFFNCVDYNRIKNNIQYIYELSLQVYPAYSINPYAADMTNTNHWWEPAEINQIEEDLQTIFEHTGFENFSIGSQKTFYYNGKFIKYDELNRIESATYNLYDRLTNQIKARKRLKFTLGGVQY